MVQPIVRSRQEYDLYWPRLGGRSSSRTPPPGSTSPSETIQLGNRFEVLGKLNKNPPNCLDPPASPVHPLPRLLPSGPTRASRHSGAVAHREAGASQRTGGESHRAPLQHTSSRGRSPLPPVTTLPDPPIRLKRIINFQNLKSNSPSALTAALSLNLTASPPQASDNPSDHVTYYNQTLSSCLNLLAPVKSKSVTFACSAPWYTPALHQLKQKKNANLKVSTGKPDSQFTSSSIQITSINTKPPSTPPAQHTTPTSST
ncbi:hypothetical protein D5F01_LYC22364 [Xyrichtys novacula]|uniref:Uncharacterized protein n=1 Tax=Xyrichtys novacula TaxID=13765 RepID=A0AAV1H6V4_XYRNO|nr:hypothetical protein D5F01_LYC22364 [Xyrichtys novacula]